MEKQNNPLPSGSEPQSSAGQHMPDTSKIVHRHLEDQNHEITEEEMKSIKITTEYFDQEYKELLDEAVAPEDDKKSEDTDRMITPWDVTS